MQILEQLKQYGLELKLSSQQLDQDAIFWLGILAKMTEFRKERIFHLIQKSQSNLKELDVYVLPLKNNEQQITSVKILFATQEMVGYTIKNRLKILEHKTNISQISRARVLGSP